MHRDRDGCGDNRPQAGHDEVLDHELTTNATKTRADRRPQRQLLMPQRCAYREQSCDIAAGDQEDGSDCDREDRDQPCRLAVQLLLEWHELYEVSTVGRRKPVGESARDAVE